VPKSKHPREKKVKTTLRRRVVPATGAGQFIWEIHTGTVLWGIESIDSKSSKVGCRHQRLAEYYRIKRLAGPPGHRGRKGQV
jgi:hypothetical protein